MTSPKRSEIYKEIFDDDEMLTAFGKLNPTVKERTAYFFDCWMDWRNNRLRFSNKIITSDREFLKEKLKQIGLRDLWDYQFRNNEIRFKNTESLAFFKIVAGDVIVGG
jgi:hypothetical protein